MGQPAAPGRAGQGKKFFSAKTQEGSCLRSTAGSLDRASWRPAGHLLSRSSVSDSRRSARREAQQQQSTRRSAISGGEQAGAPELPPSRNRAADRICISNPNFSACGAEQVSKQVREQAIRFALEQHESSRSHQQPTWKISSASGRCSSRAFMQSIKPVFFNILVCE